MAEQKHPKTKNPSPDFTNATPLKTPKNNTKKNNKNHEEFEFCKVCHRNHDQGLKHKYFPNHIKSLSSFLSRFENKLSDVRFFLKNPSVLRSEHSSRNRVWCVFCDCVVDELGSSLACSNAIKHLASSDHLKNLKSFLWRYGGGMDLVDSFTVSNADLLKWEKKYMTMKNEDALKCEWSRGSLIGPANDIHNELNYDLVDTFDKNVVQSFNRTVSNGVSPLQNDTNENYQVLNLQLSQVAKAGHLVRDVTSSSQLEARFPNDICDKKHLTDKICSKDGILKGREVQSAKRMINGESRSWGIQAKSLASLVSLGETSGNVHSGAPPPWFEATELKPESGASSIVSPLSKPGKSHKLNPKRVGAAWAEKRKIELEMEKRGEIVANNCDHNWLPNFGRVWQSGSRKLSRQEFETENKKLPNIENQSEIPVKIQPYISKRMRKEENL